MCCVRCAFGHCAAASVLLNVKQDSDIEGRKNGTSVRSCGGEKREAFHFNGAVSKRALNCLVSHYILFSQRRARSGGSFGFSSSHFFVLVFFFSLHSTCLLVLSVIV